MKTTKFYPVILLLIAGLTLVTANSYSQDSKQDKKSKKEIKRAKAESEFRTLDSLMSSGRYVLEANYLQNKYGSMVTVSSNLNFIRVDGPKGVLQTGSDLRQGYNGVGGVTATGSISNYKISRDMKNLTMTISFQLMTNLGTFDILMSVVSENIASATISGSTSGKLTWRGRIVPLDKSKVFKGQDTY
jgi:hypothetical protein